MSALKGHGLLSEGSAYDEKGRRIRSSGGTGGTGHGQCSCGALSPPLDSGSKRKAWHRRHKDRIRNPSTESDTP